MNTGERKRGGMGEEKKKKKSVKGKGKGKEEEEEEETSTTLRKISIKWNYFIELLSSPFLKTLFIC